jgi:multicomponent Na+:H+ antiporter subunit G
MILIIDIATVVCLFMAALFFLAGTLGLLRFPDVYTRLHALTKADNIGLGFIVLGLSLQLESFALVGKLVLIWLLVLISSAHVALLVIQLAQQKGHKLWIR